MYFFCNSRIHVITLYSGQVCVYYASMLRCWHLVWILVRIDHPCLGVGCHIRPAMRHHHLWSGCPTCNHWRWPNCSRMLHPAANGRPWEIRRVHTVLENPLCTQAHRLLIFQAFPQWLISMPRDRFQLISNHIVMCGASRSHNPNNCGPHINRFCQGCWFRHWFSRRSWSDYLFSCCFVISYCCR
jgi:hypothetical protein